MEYTRSRVTARTRTSNYIVDAPVDAPWVDFVHYPECEDQKLFQCPDCKTLIADTNLNVCDCSMKFIPRITECVCLEIRDEIEIAK